MSWISWMSWMSCWTFSIKHLSDPLKIRLTRTVFVTNGDSFWNIKVCLFPWYTVPNRLRPLRSCANYLSWTGFLNKNISSWPHIHNWDHVYYNGEVSCKPVLANSNISSFLRAFSASREDNSKWWLDRISKHRKESMKLNSRLKPSNNHLWR